MDNIRKKLRDEIINEDRFINRRVFSKEKDFVKTLSESVKPKGMIDFNVEVKVQKDSEILQKVLNSKIQASDNTLIGTTFGDSIYLQPSFTNKRRLKSLITVQSFNTVVDTGDVIIAYNNLIRNYLNPTITSAIKEVVKNNIQSCLPYALACYDSVNNLLLKITETDNISPDESSFITRLSSALAIYKKIYDNINNDNYSLLNFKEIQISYDDLITNYLSSPNPNMVRAGSLIKILNNVKDFNDLVNVDSRKDIELAINKRARELADEMGRPLSPYEILNLRSDLMGNVGSEGYSLDLSKSSIDSLSVASAENVQPILSPEVSGSELLSSSTTLGDKMKLLEDKYKLLIDPIKLKLDNLDIQYEKSKNVITTIGRSIFNLWSKNKKATEADINIILNSLDLDLNPENNLDTYLDKDSFNSIYSLIDNYIKTTNGLDFTLNKPSKDIFDTIYEGIGEILYNSAFAYEQNLNLDIQQLEDDLQREKDELEQSYRENLTISTGAFGSGNKVSYMSGNPLSFIDERNDMYN